MKLLGVFGIGPHLRRCLNCDAPIFPSTSPILCFHIARGGFFCEKCSSGTGALKLSATTLVLLERLQSLPAAKLWHLAILERETHEVEIFFRSYFDFHLEEVGKLRALKFVRELT
jgi:recombinational DNA repair protein (RecF pathway)